jgi:hypothetical protein
MNGTYVRSGRALVSALALAVLAAWAPRAAAYESYDDGTGHGCVECHNASSDGGGFTGGNAGALHIAHLTKFGITSCALCHSSSAGGSKPVLTYYSGAGYGCAGCHGRDQGETSIHSGKPKSSGYGLRLGLAATGITVCANCHFPGSTITGDPSPAPAVLPETVPPPYYLLSNNNLTDPCSAAQEGFEGTVGLDNDGNGSRDADDPACKARTTTPTPKPTATAAPTPGKAKKSIKVRPGESIQAAVDAVAEGGTVSVLPGTYEETHDGTAAVRITRNGIKLIGKPTKTNKVILVPHPGQDNGIVVEPAVDGQRINGSKIQGFTVKGFPHNGIFTRYVDNFIIQKNESIDNLENGIWPTLSANGLVKKNVAYGSLDSALWVEGSENIRVLDNDLHHSPTGLEITVSKQVTVQKNEVHDNTVGIGLYHAAAAGLGPGTPGLPAYSENGPWHIVSNNVHDNNAPNIGEGSLVKQLPPGGGILILGVDKVDVQKNQIENNNFFGVAIVDYCLAANNCPLPPALPETGPDNNQVIKNKLANNHGAPTDTPFKELASDMLVLGGTNNCFSKNVINNTAPLEAKTTPAQLPVCN